MVSDYSWINGLAIVVISANKEIYVWGVLEPQMLHPKAVCRDFGLEELLLTIHEVTWDGSTCCGLGLIFSRSIWTSQKRENYKVELKLLIFTTL